LAGQVFDIFIIGGGVNGCGLARDAAGRGYSVGLAEMNDLAGGTSSKSTKLVHGGLRYLETYQFGLVRESLAEREVLLRMAPHLVQPLRFVLPVQEGMRPAWLLRLGLFLYDHMGGRKTLPATSTLDLAKDDAGKPLQKRFARAFAYADCRVDDSRLVVLNARDAADRGASILARVKVVSARASNGLWRVGLRDRATGDETEIFTRLLVNAGGPWVDKVLAGALAQKAQSRLRLVRGSHIVVRKMFDHDGAYLFQNPDGRIVFAIAYQDDFTLIGTTDVDFAGDPREVAITPEETNYLLGAANDCFARRIEASDVVWSFSGLRPLVDDGAGSAQKTTRENFIEDVRIDGAPLINVFGGKITSYRRLAEKILCRAGKLIPPRGAPWTANALLPGGNFPCGDIQGFAAELRAEKPFLSDAMARRLARAYGTECLRFLGAAVTIEGLGENFGGGLFGAEVDHLVAREWAETTDDILWRRSKLGLRPEIDAEKLANYLAAKKK
jgi:glycerol-3-phosphate dehydrogenase